MRESVYVDPVVNVDVIEEAVCVDEFLGDVSQFDADVRSV